MTKIAVNYSQPMLELLKAGEELDYIKLSRADVMTAEMAMARQYRPGVLHHLLHLGTPRKYWQDFDFDELNRQIEQSRTPYLSIHLDGYVNELGEIGEADLLSELLDHYDLIKKQIRLDLIVENCDQEPVETISAGVGRFPVLMQPAFITQFLTAANCDLLLDLSHAQCAADALKMVPREYLSRLPGAKVREIHNAGSRRINEQLIDVHFPLQELDYQLLGWVLAQTKPEVVTLEYGGTGPIYTAEAVKNEKNNQDLLREQWRRLRQIVNENG